MMKTQRLMRVWYKTDVSKKEPDYVGIFSAPFPAEEPGRKIVAGCPVSSMAHSTRALLSKWGIPVCFSAQQTEE